MTYLTVDITDLTQLGGALKGIQLEFGPIKHIIHTAAVVRDAAIPNMSPAAFDEVLRPKVLGAWNLHVAAQSLDLALDSFVVLSSTK